MKMANEFYGYLNSIPNNLLHNRSDYFMIHKRSITIHSIANSLANKQGLTLDYSIFSVYTKAHYGWPERL